MADPITMLFEELAQRGHDARLAKVTGTFRLDVMNGKQTERWLLEIRKGDLSVSRRNIRADAVVRGGRSLLERVIAGKTNAIAAVLRGELTVEGKSELLVLFQRLLPRPKDASTKGVAAGFARRQR
jgi:putative sterol carrier protein